MTDDVIFRTLLLSEFVTSNSEDTSSMSLGEDFVLFSWFDCLQQIRSEKDGYASFERMFIPRSLLGVTFRLHLETEMT